MLTGCAADDVFGSTGTGLLKLGADIFGTGNTGATGGSAITELQGNEEGMLFADMDVKEVEEAPEDEWATYDVAGPENDGLSSSSDVTPSVVGSGSSEESEAAKGTVYLSLLCSGSKDEREQTVEILSKYHWYYWIHIASVLKAKGNGYHKKNSSSLDSCTSMVGNFSTAFSGMGGDYKTPEFTELSYGSKYYYATSVCMFYFGLWGLDKDGKVVKSTSSDCVSIVTISDDGKNLSVKKGSYYNDPKAFYKANGERLNKLLKAVNAWLKEDKSKRTTAQQNICKQFTSDWLVEDGKYIGATDGDSLSKEGVKVNGCSYARVFTYTSVNSGVKNTSSAVKGLASELSGSEDYTVSYTTKISILSSTLLTGKQIANKASSGIINFCFNPTDGSVTDSGILGIHYSESAVVSTGYEESKSAAEAMEEISAFSNLSTATELFAAANWQKIPTIVIDWNSSVDEISGDDLKAIKKAISAVTS